MEYQEARQKFIEAWGGLGTNWGINKTMAQIHALLLISPQSLNADQIMQELQISRGNANMNLRALLDWGIILKINKIGERKEYFQAKKDIWELAKQIARERQQREIQPVLDMLHSVDQISGTSEEVKEFKEVTKNLNSFASQFNGMLQKFAQEDQNWFYKVIMRLTR